MSSSEDETTDVQNLETGAWLMLGLGSLFAVVVFFIPFLSHLLNYLVILIHECGHALFGFLFG